MMCLKTNVLALLATAALAVTVAAQIPLDQAGGIATADAAPKGGMIALRVENGDVAPVKGAPFCATVTTEHTQSFADGNRIHTSDKSTVCRDSEGRTRREAGLNLLGAAAQKTSGRMITIIDPVAGVHYLLDPDSKVAHKMSLPAPGVPSAGPAGLPAKGERLMIYRSADGPGPQTFSTNVFFKKLVKDSNGPAPATENLGDETINGIHATGTRMTTTIPAGKMGNDGAITVTSERWYSPELKATVMSKHNDPWAGELKTELSNVNTSEPDPSLFTVPSDYKIVEDKTGPTMLMQAPPPPPQ